MTDATAFHRPLHLTLPRWSPMRGVDLSALKAAKTGFKVGLDIDGVFYPFREAVSAYLVSIGRPEHTVESVVDHWNFYEGWKMTVEEYLAVYAEGVDAGHILRRGDPYPGTVIQTHRLGAAGNAVHFVTDRSIGAPGLGALHTAAWLAEHEFYFDSMTVSANKREPLTDFFLDDRDKNYVERTQSGQNCHLLDQPWNTHLTHVEVDGEDRPVQRVFSVEEFVDVVLSAQVDAYAASAA